MAKKVTTDKKQNRDKRQNEKFHEGYRPRGSQIPPTPGKTKSQPPAKKESGSQKGKKK